MDENRATMCTQNNEIAWFEGNQRKNRETRLRKRKPRRNESARAVRAARIFIAIIKSTRRCTMVFELLEILAEEFHRERETNIITSVYSIPLSYPAARGQDVQGVPT